MNKFLLLLICAILAGGQAAFADVSNASKIYYGGVGFNRTLPGGVAGLGQQPVCEVEGVTMYAYDYGIDEVNRLAKEGVLISSDSEDNYISLQQGNILLSPDKNVLVGTSEGKISVGPGATVFIMQSANGLIVYDIAQTRTQQVTVTSAINQEVVVLEAGRMLTLTRQNAQDFETLNVNCHAITYSKVQPLDLHDSTVRAFLVNFSIASALTTIEPLKRLTVSHNKRDRIALEKLVKNVRCDKPLEIADNDR